MDPGSKTPKSSSQIDTSEVEQGFTRLIDFIKKKELKNKKKLPPFSLKAVAISAYLRQKNLFKPLELTNDFLLTQEAFKSSQSDGS